MGKIFTIFSPSGAWPQKPISGAVNPNLRGGGIPPANFLQKKFSREKTRKPEGDLKFKKIWGGGLAHFFLNGPILAKPRYIKGW